MESMKMETCHMAEHYRERGREMLESAIHRPKVSFLEV